MQIGVDASGDFAMGDGFEPTVTAAAVGSTAAFAEISDWTAEALERWGLDHKLSELHAKELFADKVREVCEMLSQRNDLRLAAVVTDSQLLGSPAAVSGHRERQRKVATNTPAITEDGARRRDAVIELLDDPKFRGAAYAFGATLPVLVVLALQQSFCYFRGNTYRDEMATINLLIDEEPARTVKYTSETLQATIGGDERFSLIVPDEWREPPIHPLLFRARHPDGDGLRPQELLNSIEYVESKHHACIQVADIAASVVRRRIVDPANPDDRENFELLQPLLAGVEGHSFEFFSTGRLREDQTSMYSHLHGSEPEWWLRRLSD
jgi:hypothetical protein